MYDKICELINSLKIHASHKCRNDKYPSITDVYKDNVEAYSKGYNDGMSMLSRIILDIFNIKYK